jgi:L-cystine uptake protein TcyP (sodium:dicarboxylate symporter family)
MCIGTAVFASPCHVAASHVPDDMATDTITVGNPQKSASFAASFGSHATHIAL